MMAPTREQLLTLAAEHIPILEKSLADARQTGCRTSFYVRTLEAWREVERAEWSALSPVAAGLVINALREKKS